MKKIALFLFFASTAFTESFVLENRTSYPTKDSKIAVQWASTAKEVDDHNKSLLSGARPNPSTLQTLAKLGKMKLTIPKAAGYFRVLAWSKKGWQPDLHTNWIEVTPNKTYTLESGHLVPTILMPGSGC